MDKQTLRILGRRCIVAGIAIVPIDILLVVLFWRWSRDFIGTFSLTMTLVTVSVALFVFGAAALSSSKDEG